jgi:nucleotidyltransferase/DNA polymerase involved in DNA repair
MDSIHSSRFLALRFPHLLAQVECRLNPALRGMAFVVATGREPRSQVLGLSPALPAEGGRGAPLASWLRRRPGLLVVEGRPERAEALLAAARQRLEALAPGLREEGGHFLLDLRGSRLLHPEEAELGRRLLRELREGDQLTAAAGIGSTPLAAQLLARRARPGEVHIAAGAQERALLDDFPLAGLPGLAPSLLAALAEIGVWRVGEARGLPAGRLRCFQGEAGLRLAALLQDLADTPPPAAAPAGLRRRLPEDSADPLLLESCLLDLLEILRLRLREEERRPRRLELALFWNDGRVQRRGVGVRAAAGESGRQALRRCGLALLHRSLAERRLRVREVAAELLSDREDGQLALFGGGGRAVAAEGGTRERCLDAALLQLRRRWGPQTVRLGLHGLNQDLRERNRP